MFNDNTPFDRAWNCVIIIRGVHQLQCDGQIDSISTKWSCLQSATSNLDYFAYRPAFITVDTFRSDCPLYVWHWQARSQHHHTTITNPNPRHTPQSSQTQSNLVCMIVPNPSAHKSACTEVWESWCRRCQLWNSTRREMRRDLRKRRLLLFCTAKEQASQ